MKCSNLYVNGRPCMITLDYTMDMTALAENQDELRKRKLKPEDIQGYVLRILVGLNLYEGT